MTKPIHTHDCDLCVHVATTTFADGRGFDVYVCKHDSGLVENVYRYGSRGDQYIARSADLPQPDMLYLKQYVDDPD